MNLIEVFELAKNNYKFVEMRNAYPTTQLTTPPMRLKSRWGCQNHPEASTAISFEGRLGVVGISGQMLLPLAKTRRAVAFTPDLLRGKDENAKQVVAKEKMMVAMERPIGAGVTVVVIIALYCRGTPAQRLACALAGATWQTAKARKFSETHEEQCTIKQHLSRDSTGSYIQNL